jgi:hypothetical protein
LIQTDADLETMLVDISEVADKYKVRFELEFQPRHWERGVRYARGWKGVMGQLGEEEPKVATVARRSVSLREAVLAVIANLKYHLPDEPILAKYIRVENTSDA